MKLGFLSPLGFFVGELPVNKIYHGGQLVYPIIGIAPPIITSPLVAQANTGIFFSYQISALNNPLSYGATGLPSGISINLAGLISGVFSSAGTYELEVSATNGGGTTSATVTVSVAIIVGQPVITSSLYLVRSKDSPINYRIQATNLPTSYSSGINAAGSVVPVTLDATTGVFSGKAPESGAYRFPISAANSANTDTQTVRLVSKHADSSGFSNRFAFFVEPDSIGVGANVRAFSLGSQTNPITRDGVKYVFIAYNLGINKSDNVVYFLNPNRGDDTFSWSIDGVTWSPSGQPINIPTASASGYGYDPATGTVWMEVWVAAGTWKRTGQNLTTGTSRGSFYFVHEGSPVLNSNIVGSVGRVWTPRVFRQQTGSPENVAYESIAYGNGKFVALGDYGLSRNSVDGIAWSNVVAAPSGFSAPQFFGPDIRLAFGNGVFVATGAYNPTFPEYYRQIITSPNGENWTVRQPWNLTGLTLQGLSFLNGKFILRHGLHPDNPENGRVWTSANGVDWQPGGITKGAGHFAYGGGKLVAFSLSSYRSFTTAAGGILNVEHSTDGGLTWQPASSPPLIKVGFYTPIVNGVEVLLTDYTGLAYGNGKFVAIGHNYRNIGSFTSYNTTWYAISEDGDRWEMREFAPRDFSNNYYRYSKPWNTIIFANGRFVAFSGRQDTSTFPDASQELVISSADGLTWEVETTPKNQIYTNWPAPPGAGTFIGSWKSATFAGDKIVAVSELGEIMTAPAAYP